MAYQHTVLSQVLKMIPRYEVEAIAKKWHVGQKFRKINHWSHFIVMFIAQLSGANSLRDSVQGFAAKLRYYSHLGCKPMARTTLARVNNEQPWEIFRDLYFVLATRFPLRSKHHFRFCNKLVSIDATTISLCLACFSWATHRKNKAGVKLHVGLDHASQVPAFVIVTNANVHDDRPIKLIKFEAGTIYVMDRAYCNYELFERIKNSGASFVTRLKTNAKFKVNKRNSANKKLGVTSDQIIEFTGAKFRGKGMTYRRIGYRDSESGKRYVYITNNRTLAAKTIAEIYKDRWQIELFFKWVKQNLRIKKFFGRTENSVLTQVWIAMITFLMYHILKRIAKQSTGLLDIARRLRYNLFSRAELLNVLRCRPPTQERQVLNYQLVML